MATSQQKGTKTKSKKQQDDEETEDQPDDETAEDEDGDMTPAQKREAAFRSMINKKRGKSG